MFYVYELSSTEHFVEKGRNLLPFLGASPTRCGFVLNISKQGLPLDIFGKKLEFSSKQAR